MLPEELPGAIERMQTDAKDHKRTVAALQTELARYRADEIAAAAEETLAGRLVLHALDADANGLKALALAISSRPGHIVALVAPSSPALVVVARSADVSIASNEILASLTKTFGGRGGGKPEVAQGGGLNGSAQEILAAARARILESAAG